MSSNNNITSFLGRKSGLWKILSIEAVAGDSIKHAESLEITNDARTNSGNESIWILKGFGSNLRYTNRDEKNILDKQPSILGKSENTYAALIPIKKSEEWWQLTQDERRNILEEQSHHIEIGSKYLSVISRKLYHSRDIGEEFDFLTWFEFAPENQGNFDELLSLLRNSEEWKYVVREVDIRLEKQTG